VDETGALHRLDRRPQRQAVPGQPPRERTQPVRVRRRHTDLDPIARLIEQTEIETLAAEIQSSVQH